MFPITKFNTQPCSFSPIMVSKVSIFLLLVIINCLVSCSGKVLRTKRADIDLQTCIKNFNIHRDKIIRTQDSRNMGAKYLTEFDLGTREECLRLCCETENCDVFVFEEKNSGGCYLFYCGPPDDFKCKFTHHANYSSAILAINRHIPDFESQIKLTKHEQDLSKLRKPESEPEVVPPVAETVITSTQPTTTIKPSKEVFSTEVKTKPSEQARKCSRYQFECRSTSECIAIYNACDGIPQCTDGSDEAPELGCPDSATTSQPATIRLNNPVPPPRYDANIPQQPLHPLAPVLSQGEIYHPQDALGPPQMPPIPHQDADFLRPLPNPRNSHVPFDNQQMLQYGPGPIQVPSNWGQHQPQMMSQIPQFADKNSHIFNHKENGLQVPDGQEIRYNKYKGAMQYLHRALGYSSAGQMQYGDGRDQYNPKMNYYDTYRQQIQQETWPNGPEDVQFSGYPQEAAGTKEWHQEGLPNENSRHEQEKMAHELKHSKDNAEHPNADPEPKIKIEKHKSTKNERYPDVSSYKMEGTDLQDGVSETASGAVLSLTLGLIITCIMALLIACRLRVRRRMRKGGKSYAHDADYLVNGMYL